MESERRDEARALMEQALCILDAIGEHAAAAHLASALHLLGRTDSVDEGRRQSLN